MPPKRRKNPVIELIDPEEAQQGLLPQEDDGVPISVEQEETHEDASGRENILISQEFERWKLEQEFKLQELAMNNQLKLERKKEKARAQELQLRAQERQRELDFEMERKKAKAEGDGISKRNEKISIDSSKY